MKGFILIKLAHIQSKTVKIAMKLLGKAKEIALGKWK